MLRTAQESEEIMNGGHPDLRPLRAISFTRPHFMIGGVFLFFFAQCETQTWPTASSSYSHIDLNPYKQTKLRFIYKLFRIPHNYALLCSKHWLDRSLKATSDTSGQRIYMIVKKHRKDRKDIHVRPQKI